MVPQRFENIVDAVRQLSAESGPVGVMLTVHSPSGLNTWDEDIAWIVGVPDAAEDPEAEGNPATLYLLREVVIR